MAKKTTAKPPHSASLRTNLVKFCLAAPLLLLLAGCASNQQPTTALSPLLFGLGVPLDSEAGQIKLAALQSLSETIFADKPEIRFVPLSEAEIQQVHTRFRHDLRPGTQAEYVGNDVRDKSTKEKGIGIEIQDVKLNGSEADVRAKFYRAEGIGSYQFRVVKIDQNWRVHDFTFAGTVSSPALDFPNCRAPP